MTLSPKYYDLGQWVIRTLVPAFITLYSGLELYVGVPKVAEVIGITGLLATFLGVLLASSSRAFKKTNEPDGGDFQLKGYDENGMPRIGLDVKADPADLAGKKTVTLRIDATPVKNPSAPELEEQPSDNVPPWRKVDPNF